MKSKVVALLGLVLVFISLSGGCGAPTQAPTPETPKPVATAAPVTTPPPKPPARQVALYRDEWGVPHIFAETAADAAFAMGYAQAEDRLEDIYKAVRLATGTMAEAFGKEHVETDYVMRLARNAEVCQEYWAKTTTETLAIGDNFMRGVEAYVAEHPERKPEFACDLYGWQCGAIGRAMILEWPLGNLMDELRRKDRTPDFGSNGWAVAPSRSADGCAILMTDPHLTWEGLAVFYEARIHCREFEAAGFFIVGTALPALGHSSHVAWACTTGGPDTSDVYRMKLDPKIPFLYEYDGQMKTAELKMISIPVKGSEPVARPAFYTINGPAIEEPDTERGVVCVGNTPYLNEAGLFEQVYKMVQAKNCDEFYAALAMNQLMEQNVIFADRDGNIQYVRTGRTPIRPEGYDWSAPVPGNTSKTQWLGIHDIKDLVQIKNPAQGYMQNCNISPELMMEGSPMTRDKYRDYIYNVSWDYTNPRGRRALQLLAADSSLTKEEAMAIGVDVYDLLAEPWQKALKNAVRAVGAAKSKDADFSRAVETILAWDGQFTKDSAAAPLVKFWRVKCQDAVDIAAIADEKPLGMEDEIRLLDLLSQTLADIKTKYGRLDITWGDMNVAGRGGKYFPCSGADFGGGKDKRNETATLLNISTQELPDQPGKCVGVNGSGSFMICFLRKEGIESYSCVVWGQSGDPESPHYVDQSEKLYANRQYKPTWFRKEELLKHVESEEILTVP